MYYPRSHEIDLENKIGATLESVGYLRRQPTDYAYDTCCDKEVLFSFLTETQPDALAAIYRKWYGDPKPRPDTIEKVAHAVWHQILKHGKLNALKCGVDVERIHLVLYYPRPTADAATTAIKHYKTNRLTYIRQVPADRDHKRIVDIVTFANGLSFSLHEIKQSTNEQDYLDAQDQWIDTKGNAPLFAFNTGFIVAFAVDEQDASMTTRLDGKNTVFFPFDKGQGEGVDRTTGNPIPGPNDPYATHYLYDRTLSKDNITAYIFEYCMLTNDAKPALIFPRYHQLDLVERLRRLVETKPTDCHYALVEHFAGSGKTWEIVWASYILASLCEPNSTRPLYGKVIVITNRIVLDSQLSRALKQKQETLGYLTITDNTRELEKALKGRTRIICTTVQKMFYLMHTKGALNSHERYHILIDEIQSGYEAKHMEALKQYLADVEFDENIEIDDSTAIQNAIAREIEASGRPSNLSFTVFSATPTESTYRVFGTPDAENHKRAFHIYTMRQAIDEGYILNPLSNVIVYKTTFKAVKKGPEDPDYVPYDVSRVVGGKVVSSEKGIANKAQIAADIFAEVVHGKFLHGYEKMQIMAASRREAFLYYKALCELSQHHKYKMIAPLVAFTGSLDIDGQTYTEAGLNGFPDTQTAQQFATDNYNIMVVARKFMVGFDEKRLCAQFVDVRLSGVNAVQATTRIDRVIKGEDKQTLIVLCRNSFDELVDAYRPFFASDGAAPAEPGQLEKIYNQILQYNIISADDAHAFYAAAAKAAATGIPMDNNGAQYYASVRARFGMATEEHQKQTVSAVRKFSIVYMSASMTEKISDVRYIEMKALVDELLRQKKWFKAPDRRSRLDDIADIDSRVAVEQAGFEPMGGYSLTDVSSVPEQTHVPGNAGTIGATRDELRRERLSKILQRLNWQFSKDNDIVAININSVLTGLALSPKSGTVAAAQNNNEDEFADHWSKVVFDALIKILTSEAPGTPLYAAANEIVKDDKLLAEISSMYRSIAYKAAKELI